MKNNIQVSVVIPAFNEEKYIENTLFSLLTSEQKTYINYEVVLVDNNSTDKTIAVAQKFAYGMDLRIIKEVKQGRGAARARGFEEAKGDIILSADADTIFYKGWVEKLSSSIKGDVVAVTTSCKIVDSTVINNAVINFIQPKAMVLYKILLGHFWLSGFSFAISKSAYKKSGGFNPNLEALEDIDLSFKVSKVGKIRFIDKPVIFSGRRFRKGLVAGFYEYIQSFVEAFILGKKHIHFDNPR